jgi:hypothetical protein
LAVLNACPAPIPAGAVNRMAGLGVTLARPWYPALRIEGRVPETGPSALFPG